MIYLISGKARHGKDTVATMLQQSLPNSIVVHYADYLKFVCREYKGWNGEKDEAGRKLLQVFGTEHMRGNNPDIWVRVVIELIKGFGDMYNDVIIPDVRFPNEILLMDELFDVVTVRVTRINADGSPFDNGLTAEQKRHSSETALDKYPFDYSIIAKSGDTGSLNKSVQTLIRLLR